MANELEYVLEANTIHKIMDRVNRYAIGNLFETKGEWDDDAGEMINQKLGTIIKSRWKFDETYLLFICEILVVFDGETHHFAIEIDGENGEHDDVDEIIGKRW